MKTPSRNYLLLLILLCLLTGCGGGASSGSDDAPTTEEEIDNEFPTANITFPSSNGLWSDKEQLTVRGSASDNIKVVSVRVNGIEASSDNDFETWQAKITLEEGSTTAINVEVTDVNGNTSANAASIGVNSYDDFYSYRLYTPLAFDSDRNLAYTFNPTRELNLETMQERHVDSELSDVEGAKFDQGSGNFYLIKNDELLSVDREFNTIEVISATEDQSLSFGRRPHISIDYGTRDIYVQSYYKNYLIKVDPATGEREKISSITYEDGSSVGNFIGGIEIVDGRFFLVSDDGLLELNPDTWLATEISGSNIGSGDDFIRLAGLSIDLINNLAYTTDIHSKVFEINLVSGDRKSISSGLESDNENLIFSTALSGIIDVGESLIVNSSFLTGHTLLINKRDGSRALISKKTRGKGPLLSTTSELVYDEFRKQTVILNDIYTDSRDYNSEFDKVHQIIAIDPVSGDREIISGPNNGGGIVQGYLRYMAIDNRDGHIYVKELESDTIIRIDPITGNRTIVSGDCTGTGDDFNGLSGLSVDTMKDRILAISSSSLISVNLQSGDRNTITSFPDIGSLSLATYTTINNESSKVYIVDLFKGIVEFDLETEVARIVSSDEVGSGPELNEPTHIAVDRKNNRLFVEDYNDRANEDDPINVELLVVDIETGNRIQLLSLFEQEYEQMALTPAVDQANDLLYISMPNRGVAIFDVETKQYLMISQ